MSSQYRKLLLLAAGVSVVAWAGRATGRAAAAVATITAHLAKRAVVVIGMP